jgi:hypothetical protein
MDTIITAIVNVTVVPMANGIAWMASSGVLLVVFALLWSAFAVGIVWSQGSLDAAWTWLRDLPLLVQAVVWLLFLPVTIGLWVWEQGWPILVRLVLIVGLAGWSILMFIPRGAAKG